jgi:hypothetical protein
LPDFTDIHGTLKQVQGEEEIGWKKNRHWFWG